MSDESKLAHAQQLFISLWLSITGISVLSSIMHNQKCINYLIHSYLKIVTKHTGDRFFTEH